jgi:hypothetical protein
MNRKTAAGAMLVVCLAMLLLPVQAAAKQTNLLEFLMHSILQPQQNVNIKILNPVSTPTLWGRWELKFETEGEGDLEIEAYNGTYFGKDIEFIALTCNDKKTEAEGYFSVKANNESWIEGIDNGKIVARDWKCENGTGRLFLKILATGHHYLKFSFMSKTAYAENLASCTGTDASPCHMCDTSDMDYLLRDPADSNDPRGWQDSSYSSSSGGCTCTCYTEDCCALANTIQETWTDSDGYVYCSSEGTYDIQSRAYAQGDAYDWDYSSWVTAYTVSWDSDQNWCNCKVGATNCNGASCWNGANPMTWESGTSQSCCEDDASEFYAWKYLYPSNTGEGNGKIGGSDTSSDACCNGVYDCFYNGNCYATNAYYDLDSDGRNDYRCYPSQDPSWWINVDYHTSYCTANGFHWNMGGDADVEGAYYETTGSRPNYCTIGSAGYPSRECCCGDDSGENYRYCQAASGFPDSGSCTSSQDGCCDASTDCVATDGTTCVTSGSTATDGDGNGDTDYCNAGTWYDCLTDANCPIESSCVSNDCVDNTINGGSGTTCDASNKCLLITNSTGAVKARFDKNGYIDIKGAYNAGQGGTLSCSNCFQIRNSAGTVMLYVDNSGNMYTKGYFYKQTSPAPSGNDDFIVRDSAGTTAGFIDGATGNMYFKGVLHYNSNF